MDETLSPHSPDFEDTELDSAVTPENDISAETPSERQDATETPELAPSEAEDLSTDDEDETELPEAIDPINSFEEMPLLPALKKALTAVGFTTPTPIQAAALPILLGEPTDLLAQAMTGTGKTAAFGLPILHHIQPKRNVLQALILCPTRELAQQVSDQIEQLGKPLGIKVLPIYGGVNPEEQLRGIRQGVPVAVATPGRLLDCLRRNVISLNHLTTLVLDEADQMMLLGFREEVETILAKRPPKRCRVWLFSATLSREVRQVAEEWLHTPQQVLLNAAKDLPEGLTQEYFATQESNKPEVLCKLIDSVDDPYGLIFCQTKALASDLATYLAVRGYPVACLHGDKDQAARTEALDAFRSHEVQLLVCTDVAARGLDIPEITHVINYSLPRESDVYLHRVGRTARSGRSGKVFNLISPAQRGQVKHLELLLGTEIPAGYLPTRRDLGQKKLTALLSRFAAQDPTRAMELLDADWLETLGQLSRKQIAGAFLNLLLPEVFSGEGPGRQVLGQRKPDLEDDDAPAVSTRYAKSYQAPSARTKLASRQIQHAKEDAKKLTQGDEARPRRKISVERYGEEPKPTPRPYQNKNQGRPSFSAGKGYARLDRYDKEDGDKPRYGGGDKPRYGGSDKPRYGGGDKPRYGDSDKPRYGGSDKPRYGDGDKPRYGGGDKPRYGGSDKPRYGDGDKPRYGGGDKPRYGDGDKPRYGGGDKPRYGDGDKPRYGGGDKPR
ncbi:MAG: DEAD/DEAH box helicase, partial [Candidatus Sericytochromatia bacterium]